MSVTLRADWAVASGELRVRAVLHNEGDEPVLAWTALRRVRLDDMLVHGDPRWVFVNVEDGCLHLRRHASDTSTPNRPGVLPPDLWLVEPGTEHVEAVALPLPVRENDPVERAKRLEAGETPSAIEPATVTSLKLTLGYLPLGPEVRRAAMPLGPPYPGILRVRHAAPLLPHQRLVTAELEAPQPLDVLRYPPLRS